MVGQLVVCGREKKSQLNWNLKRRVRNNIRTGSLLLICDFDVLTTKRLKPAGVFCTDLYS